METQPIMPVEKKTKADRKETRKVKKYDLFLDSDD
jgi:hypothetical protein